MWKTTRATKLLGLRYPVIQGPFGSGHSSTALLAAVSNAGGLGSFGAHHLDAKQLRALGSEIRTLTSKPFALNLWISDHDGDGLKLSKEAFEKNTALLRPYFRELGLADPVYPEKFGQKFDDQIEALLEIKPPVFSFVFGLPSKEVLAECRKRGIITIGAATTVDEALLLDEAKVDLIVASGCEAGGHRVSFLAPPEDSLIGTFALVPMITDRVKAPVIAAGGIADGRGVAAALALGAQAVQVGTAFLACEESNANAPHRAKLFSADAQRTALTRAFTGRLARSIRNRFLNEMKPYENQVAPYPAQGWFTKHLKDATVAQGRTDLMSLWAGQATPLIRHKKAAELLESLVREADQILRRFGAEKEV